MARSRRFPLRYVAVACIALWLAGCASMPNDRDLDYQRLARSLDQLQSDPRLGALAPAAIDRARAALQDLKDNGGRGAERAHKVYMAERRLDIAWASAQAEEFEGERLALQQRHDRLLLAAARRDAAQARAELEKQRLQAQIQAEEAARSAQEAATAQAQVAQATQDAEAAQKVAAQAKRIAAAQAAAAALAKKEARLAEEVSAGAAPATNGPHRLALPDRDFAAGQSVLGDAARKSLTKFAAAAKADEASRIRVEGRGELGHRRAESVREALLAEGIAAARVRVVAGGSRAAPAEGVEVVIEGR